MASNKLHHSIVNASETKSSKLLRAIGKLAGNAPNLKVTFQEFKFSRGKMNYLINGDVTFNVIRANPSTSLNSDEANKAAKTRE